MATDTLPLTRKYYTADEINFTPGERSFVAWISVETVDREGDVVVAKGIDFGEYMTNPVVVAIHDYGKWPLGQCEWLKVKSTPKWKGLYGKANVDDDRESPSYHLMELLQKRGAEVSYHDPYVPVIRPSRDHAAWAGLKSVPWDRATLASFDCVLISTAHANVNYQELADWASLIVYTRNAMNSSKASAAEVVKA